jgi:hypothetical protein
MESCIASHRIAFPVWQGEGTPSRFEVSYSTAHPLDTDIVVTVPEKELQVCRAPALSSARPTSKCKLPPPPCLPLLDLRLHL